MGSVTEMSHPPRLDGEFRLDPQSLEAVADDFGHLVHHAPRAVVLPASLQDVATTIRWAMTNGQRVVARARGSSIYGRSQIRDGIVVDMSRLHAVHSVEGDRITVDAGATWREVLAATLPRGLTPPVLPEYLDLSVGGTLVVGGVGGATRRFGAQCDQVFELQVVTGRGELLTCSPTHHVALFDAVRAGLAQVAVITRATLRLVPAPRQVRRFLLSYRNLAAMLTDARLLAADDRFDAVQGAVLPAPAGGWAFRLDVVTEFTERPPDDDALLTGLRDDRPLAQPSVLPYADYLARLDALVTALRAHDRWLLPHPWLTTFVGDASVDEVVAGELAEMAPNDLGPPFGQVVLSPMLRRTVATPLLRLPPDELNFAFNLVRCPATADAAKIDRLVAANRSIYDRVRAAGGTLYPASAALPMSPHDWRHHFGEAFDRLRAAKSAFDPDRVLAPGYEVF